MTIYTTKYTILLCCVAIVYSAFPSNFKKCSKKDPTFSECCKNAANNGIAQLTKAFPELNFAAIDPLEINELDIAPGSKNVVALNQKFTNCKIYGISKGTFNKFDINFSERALAVEMTIPDIKLNCQYEFDGQILILPIVGKGHATIDQENNKINFKSKWEEVKKNNKTFMKVTTSDLVMEVGLMEFNIENLFNGDKILGDNVNKVLNENWDVIFKDTKSGYEKIYAKIVQEKINSFFSTISMEEAFE